MIKKFREKIKPISHFLWLTLLIAVSVFVTFAFENNKNSQYKNIKKTFNNVYIQKSLTKLTSNLEDRFREYNYIVKDGDNYETIINSIIISKKERKLFLKTVKKKIKN